jgi:hypothetical protein
MEILIIIRWIAFAALIALWFFIAAFNTYSSFRNAFFLNVKFQSAIPLIGTLAALWALSILPMNLPQFKKLSILIAIFFADGTWIFFAIIGSIYRRLKNKSAKL